MVELYLPMFIMFAIAAGICAVMLLGGQFLGPKNPTPEKRLPFECGNDTAGSRGVKLSVMFYLTAILFVVFDIEAVFIYPLAVKFKELGWIGLGSMFGFLAVVVVALVYVVKKGALEWES